MIIVRRYINVSQLEGSCVLVPQSGARALAVILSLSPTDGEVVVMEDQEETEEQEVVMVADQGLAGRTETACPVTPLAN